MQNSEFGKWLLILLCAFICQSLNLKSTKAVGLPQPNLTITGSVIDVNGGTLQANDVVEYTLNVVSTGDDSATLIVLTNTIPANTSYVSGSLKVDSIAKSDLSLDDEAEYSAFQNRVTFRLGVGATAITGGLLLPGASTILKFRVRVGTLVPNGTAISNQATATYVGTVVPDPQNALSDSDPNGPGAQPNLIFVNIGPPNIALIHSVSPGGLQIPGTELSFTSTFTNTGAAAAQNFYIIEPVPHNTWFKLASASMNLGSTGLGATLRYSNDGGLSFLYVPVSGGGGAPAGYDGNVTHIQFVFTGLLPTIAPNNTGIVGFTARIH